MEYFWSCVGVISSIGAVVLYPMSSASKQVFKEWNLLNICLYSLFSFIFCGTTPYVMFLEAKWPLPTRLKNLLLKGKTYLSFGAVTAISVYSFFSHKKVSEEPDIFSLLSFVAFAVTFFSLSRKFQHGPEVELLYFCLELFVTDLMEIKWPLVFAAAGVGNLLIFLFSFAPRWLRSDPALQKLLVPVKLPIKDADDIFETLMTCAKAIQQNSNNEDLEDFLGQVDSLVAPAAGGMKVVSYFMKALTHRINSQAPDFSSFDERDFYESFVYFKFAHFTANQAILWAKSKDSTNKVLHVIDLGLKPLVQWSALLESLESPEVESFRVTAICLPQRYNAQHMQEETETSHMQEEIRKLTQDAHEKDIDFEYKEKRWEDLDNVQIRPNETVVVSSFFELHRFNTDTSSNGKEASEKIKNLKPNMMIMAEQEANHNGTSFVERLEQAFPYYRDVFDSLQEPLTESSELYLEREIYNVVGCEGNARVERHEPHSKWEKRMKSAGFDQVRFDSETINKVESARYLWGNRHKFEHKDRCLMLGSHSRPHIVVSAWTVKPKENVYPPLPSQTRSTPGLPIQNRFNV